VTFAASKSGIQRKNGVRSATSTMYQSFLVASQRAPNAFAASFSAKGVTRLILMWALSLWGSVQPAGDNRTVAVPEHVFRARLSFHPTTQSIQMKTIVRLFFKTLRLLLGPVMRAWEVVSRPKGVVRAPAQQAEVDAQCRNLVLYQFKTCPFCIKVRKEMHRLSLNIERRDAQKEGAQRAELVAGLGQPKVPCLKITDAAGNSQWLVESVAINAYLKGRFANA
jgi:glutaredoxin